MSETNTPISIDVEQVLHSKFPHAKVPKFLLRYLKRIVHQDEINQHFRNTVGVEGLDFVQATLDMLQISTSLQNAENLPNGQKPMLFVSNHPLGGPDGLIIAKLLGQKYEGHIRVFVNDLLMHLTPLQNIFVPINKVGGQSRKLSTLMDEAYRSTDNLLTFPAGACSRKIHGRIQDYEWKKNFVQKAVAYQRDIVPLYFEGHNSPFFYRLAIWRKRLGIKMNVEMLYLSDEMFKQRGKHFVVHVGAPIPWQTFDNSRTTAEWAQWVRAKTYALQGH